MQEQSERQKQIEKVLQAKRDSTARRRSRAVAKGNEQIKWEADFDRERLSKRCIDPHETEPFVNCETVDEILKSARIFAYAFRHARVDCPDIQVGERISDFARRVAALWYSVPVGEIMSFVSLRTLHFDDDMGFRRAREFDFTKCWYDLPGTDVVVDVSALQPVGEERQIPDWEKAGFASYADYKEDLDEQARKKKIREELDRSLRSVEEIEKDFKKQPTDETTPQLLYSGTIIEH